MSEVRLPGNNLDFHALPQNSPRRGRSEKSAAARMPAWHGLLYDMGNEIDVREALVPPRRECRHCGHRIVTYENLLVTSPKADYRD